LPEAGCQATGAAPEVEFDEFNPEMTYFAPERKTAELPKKQVRSV
jgi:hypothetical protein